MADDRSALNLLRGNHDKSPSPVINTTNDLNPVHRNRDSYWFAHSGVEELKSQNANISHKSYESKDAQLQREREERIRLFREQQEEERQRRLKEIEGNIVLSRKHREQQEEERKRKIEEARVKESERRQQVEERKRQIWEAEQERKEAILRRNLEREARIEARRNAQRMSMSFAFGSSTPRTFDLDLAALGGGRSSALGCPLMSSVSGRKSEERDFGSKRATSACSLDRKSEMLDNPTNYDDTDFRHNWHLSSIEPLESSQNIAKQIAIEHRKSDGMKACLTMYDDILHLNAGSLIFSSECPSSRWLMGSGALVGDDCMSRSMISLPSSRGRRRTDLTPVVPRERSITPHVTPRGNMSSRAVSMTRLDQLAQPRRRYLETTNHSAASTTTTSSGSSMISPSMSKSMCNLANSTLYAAARKLSTNRILKSPTNMSRSMMHLPNGSNRVAQGHQPRICPSPTNPPNANKPLTKLRSAQSMTHLAAPKLTRTAKLRATALASARQEGHTASMLNLSKNEVYNSGRLMLSAKDTSRSPSRPQSSMSGKSEISIGSSQASSVSYRPKPAPRKPRPVSIAGTNLDRSSVNLSMNLTRHIRPSVETTPSTKPTRAKSADIEQLVKTTSVPKKPVPPPKSAQVLAKARNHHVPTKDNLRKVKVPATPKAELQSKLECRLETAQAPPLPEKKIESPQKPSSESTVPSTSTSAREDTDISSSSDLDRRSEYDERSDAVPMPSEVNKDDNNLVPPTLPSLTKEEPEALPQDSPLEDETPVGELGMVKPRITSEEEAKAALAEKRRLAREQAEREAEAERQRQEELRRQEEERRLQEELEQKRQEEEQIRLAELHRKMEEEKLQRAIEEQRQREEEERQRKEEEARLKAERDEQERKAREEAERQRLELDEKLRREEQERAERKRRVEQIMSRTRNKGAAKDQPSPSIEKLVSPASSENSTSFPSSIATRPTSVMTTSLISDSPVISNNKVCNGSSNVVQSCMTASVEILGSTFGDNTPSSLDSETLSASSDSRNSALGDSSSQFIKVNGMNCVPNRTANVAVVSPLQTNGYSSHEDMSLTSSPEDRSDKSEVCGDVTNKQFAHLASNISTTNVGQLIDISTDNSTNNCNDNCFIKSDDLNSNLMSVNETFITFSENIPKKQETTVTDLL